MRSTVLIPLVGILFHVSAGFSDAQTRTLTLEQAVAIALERNLNVVQAQNNVEAAQASALAAHGTYLPTLSASGGWTRTQLDYPATVGVTQGGEVVSGFSVTNNFRTGIEAGYTIFDGFQREAGLNSAVSRAVSSEFSSYRTRQTIAFQTESAYINVLRSEQLVRVNEENLKRDRRQLERITEANRVGALSLADVYRQQSAVASDELALITAQNNYNKAKADLMSFIGLDLSEEYVLEDPSLSVNITQDEVARTMGQYSNFAELVSRALAARPDYMGAQENHAAASSGVSAARAGYFPTLSAFAGYTLSSREFSTLGSDNKSLNWGLTLRWNLFDGFRTNQSLQSAIASRRNAEIALAQAERDIQVEVKKALLDLDAAAKAYDVSQKGLVSATEDRKIAEERYNLGAGTLLDLLTANANLVNAEANRINASYNYIVAKRNVEFVLGERSY